MWVSRTVTSLLPGAAVLKPLQMNTVTDALRKYSIAISVKWCCVVTQRLLLPSWQCSRSSVCCSCDCQFCPKDAKPPFCMKFRLTSAWVLSMIAITPLIMSESSAKVCCFVLLFIQLAYYRYLILWMRHARRAIPTCHTHSVASEIN